MNKKVLLSELSPLMAEVLDNAGEVTFTITGNSMFPLLRHHRDKVCVVKPRENPLKKQDIPLFRVLSGGKRMKKIMVQKSGWNINALLAGPFWYLSRGMVGRGLLLLFLCLASLGIGVLPVWIYCGFRGNRDFYRHLKQKGVFIRE